jgi:hypothetical protein
VPKSGAAAVAVFKPKMAHLNGSPRILIVLLSVPITAMGAAAEAPAAP